MGSVWVRAKAIIRTEENGKLKTFYPGDWCQTHRHQAREWLTNGQAEILKPAILQTVQDLTDCTVLLRGYIPEAQRISLSAKFPGVPFETYQGHPISGRFLLWDTSANLRQDLILTGFYLLNKWQLAIPLLNYEVLAENVGTADERAETKAIIHDLRVPIYDCRLIFARDCQETRRLFELWDGASELGFLRALYQARPVVNALPPSWVMRS